MFINLLFKCKFNLAHSYINSYKPASHALKKHRILKIFPNNKDIVILHPDKGSGTVILNRDDYIKKLSDIINDTSKFKKLSADPTLLRQGQLQCFLRKLKNKQFFTKKFMIKVIPPAQNLLLFTAYQKFII